MTKQVGDSQLIDTWAAAGPIVDPDVSKKDEGWQLGEQPPHEWMNWLQNTFGQKLNHILKNGAPDWNADTEYTDGVVRHDGSVWLSVETNTNSEPSAVNSNWVQAVSPDGVVLLSGNQTIAGVKTFSSSPVIPDAAANNNPVALGQFASSLTENGYQPLPSGLIIQWGTIITDGWTDVTFPITFPNGLFNVIATNIDTGGVVETVEIGGAETGVNRKPDQSSFRVLTANPGTTPAPPGKIYWQAIGH